MLATIVVFGLIAAAELPGLVRRRQWGELAVVAFFLVAGLTLTMFLGLGGQIPQFKP